MATEYAMQRHEVSLRLVASGSFIEAAGGIAGLILGILGLAGVWPELLAAVAVLAIGFALLAEGGALAARYADLAPEMAGGREATSHEFGTGLTAELIGGIAGVCFGVLALLRVAPTTLLSVAALVFGGALLIGSAATARLNDLRLGLGENVSDRTRRLAEEAISGATGAQVLVGLSDIVLGILSLVGVVRMDLVLIAMLATGVSVLLTGTVVGSRLMSVIQH